MNRITLGCPRDNPVIFEVEPVPGTADGDCFEVLPTLIKEYEDRHFATRHGDPVDVLHFTIASTGGKSQSPTR